MKLLITLLLLVCSTISYAGGEYDWSQKPVAGQLVTYKRMAMGTISNMYGQSPGMEMVSERIKLYPDNSVVTTFERRVSVGYADFAGKKYPLYNPATGAQIGTVDGDILYSVMYSTWILGEKKADGLIRYSDPQTICYVTHSTDTVCQ